MEATPVVVKGVMYIPTGMGGVMAIDATTGAIRWKYQSPNGGSTNRGVAVGEGKVFSSGGGNTLIALDQEMGGLVWTAKVGDRGSTVAPAVYYDGLVYMGVSGGETGVRGHFGAFDGKTGKEVWDFGQPPLLASAVRKRGKVIPGNMAAALSGRNRRSIPSWAWSTWPSEMLLRILMEQSAVAIICLRPRSSRSTLRPALTSGIFRKCIMTFGTMTMRARPFLRT